MRNLKTYETYENKKYENIINKYIVYYYGNGKRLYLTHCKDVSEIPETEVACIIGLDYALHLGQWTNYKSIDTDVRFMNILGTFDTLKEAKEFYDMVEETKNYNI